MPTPPASKMPETVRAPIDSILPYPRGKAGVAGRIEYEMVAKVVMSDNKSVKACSASANRLQRI
jgi:hypothetical protein